MPGLNIGEFLTQRAAPEQLQRPDYYNMLGGIGEAIGRGRRADEELALQQQAHDLQGQEFRNRASNEAQDRAMRGREADRSHGLAVQREALYAKQEERRNREAVLDRAKLTDQEHERLIHQLYYAQTPQEQLYAAAELERHGYKAEPLEGPTAPNVPPPIQPVATPAAAPEVKESVQPRAEATAPRQASKLSSELDSIDSQYSKGLGVAPGLPGGESYRRAMAAAKGAGALGVEQVPGGWRPIPKAESDRDNADPTIATPSRYLPGQNPVVARSSQLLSDGDPYNNIR